MRDIPFFLIPFANVQLLCGLLHCACGAGVGVSDVEALLETQVLWLKNVARNARAAFAAATGAPSSSSTIPTASSTPPGSVGSSGAGTTNPKSASSSSSGTGNSCSTGEGTTTTTTNCSSSLPPVPVTPAVDPTLLEGHLCVTRELLAFLSPQTKYWIGGDASSGILLIKELVEDFIFPFSKVYLQLEHSTVIPAEQVNPVCATTATVIAAYDLLVTLCTGCAANLTIVAEMLTNMYYSGQFISLVSSLDVYYTR